MGQRSQIYVMLKDVDCGEEKKSDLVLANYYQWNFGYSMISRAKSIIEYLQYFRIKNYCDFLLGRDNTYRIKLSRIADTNFDEREITLSHNILEEYKENIEWCFKKGEIDKIKVDTFKEYVFDGQDNNDGKLYIMVTNDKIKYLFSDDDNKKIMSAKEYLKWDTNYDIDKEYDEILENNINYIEKDCELMTNEEFEAFKNYDFPIKNKILNELKDELQLVVC